MDNLKAVLFDLDGTLIDSEPWQYEAYKNAYAEFGYVLTQDLFFREMVVSGLSIVQFTKKYDIPIERDKIFIAKKKYFFEYIKKEVKLNKGVRELLEFVKKPNLKKALVTSSSSETANAVLEAFDLQSYFDVVITRDMVEKPKPDKEPYLKALQSLNLKNNEAIVLEDNPCGIRSAKANDIFCIAIPHDFVKGSDFSDADLVLDNCFKVIEFIESYLG